jgi:beta-glucosidase
VEAFCEYVEIVASRLGDRVTHWITQNEPWVISWLGYGYGEHAPGRTSEADAVAAAHHVLLAHGRAVEVIRREAPGAEVGITLDLIPMHPLTGSEADAAASRVEDGTRNRWFLEPVLRGTYPADVLPRFEPLLPFAWDEDLCTIGAPIDLLGVNYYRRHIVRAAEDGTTPVVVHPTGVELTEMGWEVYPEGLHELLVGLREWDTPPLYVTENGAAFPDTRTNGNVEDPARTAYLESHLDAISRAIADGAPVHGYFVWSLLDNFEWARGFEKRFGIVYVDYETLERVPKASFRWYRDFIAAQRSAAATQA